MKNTLMTNLVACKALLASLLGMRRPVCGGYGCIWNVSFIYFFELARLVIYSLQQ